MKQTNKKFLEELIRVDHAGERGAIKIYEGQLLALKTFLIIIIDKTTEINKFIVANDKPKILKSTFLQDLGLLFANSCNNSLAVPLFCKPFIWQTKDSSKKPCSTPK